MSTLKIADSDGIAVVTFARPPVNAMDSASLEELTSTFERLAEDAAVKAAVLTGEGNVFSAGLDLNFPSCVKRVTYNSGIEWDVRIA